MKGVDDHADESDDRRRWVMGIERSEMSKFTIKADRYGVVIRQEGVEQDLEDLEKDFSASRSLNGVWDVIDAEGTEVANCPNEQFAELIAYALNKLEYDSSC